MNMYRLKASMKIEGDSWKVGMGELRECIEISFKE